eukprot:m.114185 g.114185  ORF g.114185 m.114185 type:complete len:192 (-) comp12813_c1_seq3:1051-1626(-)
MPHKDKLRPLEKDALFLFSGCSFSGTQKSERYEFPLKAHFEVVDFEQKSLCGILSIENLTPHLPQLQTYFDVDLVTSHKEFETTEFFSTRKNDIEHWTRLPGFHMEYIDTEDAFDFKTNRYIYMRWKERFLIPHDEEQDLRGASFEGFYFVCFDRLNGSISGFYHHDACERYQAISLKYEDPHLVPHSAFV